VQLTPRVVCRQLILKLQKYLDYRTTTLEIIFDLPIGFPINNIISLLPPSFIIAMITLATVPNLLHSYLHFFGVSRTSGEQFKTSKHHNRETGIYT